MLPLQAAKHRARRRVAGHHVASSLLGRDRSQRRQPGAAVQADRAPLLCHGVPLPLRCQTPGGYLPQLPPLFVSGGGRGACSQPLEAAGGKGRRVETAGQRREAGLGTGLGRQQALQRMQRGMHAGSVLAVGCSSSVRRLVERGDEPPRRAAACPPAQAGQQDPGPLIQPHLAPQRVR